MSTRKNLLVAIGVALVLGLSAKLWYDGRVTAVIRSVTNIDLTSDARLIDYSSQSSRFGAEGERIWKYSLTQSYADELRRTCESNGYSITRAKDLFTVNPFLSEHVDRNQDSCVRRIERDIYGISVIQGSRLVVVILY